MIDFHSHIIPGIDDGSKDINMSIKMLCESYKMGVNTVVATPHCYIREQGDIQNFLKRRQEGIKKLIEAVENSNMPLPKIKIGAEVRVFYDIADIESLRPLCIENSDYILVEMPYGKWDENCYDFLYRLIIKGMRPVMAHIERFYAHEKEFYNLEALNLTYQVNAESLTLPEMKKPIENLFKRGMIQFLGSDMHNTTTRTSNMDEAKEVIKKKYGYDCYNYIMANGYMALENRPIENIRFKKRGIIDIFKK